MELPEPDFRCLYDCSRPPERMAATMDGDGSHGCEERREKEKPYIRVQFGEMASEKKALEGKSVVYDKCGAPAGYESDLGSRRDALLAYLTGGGQYFRVGGSGSVQGMVQCVQDLSAAQCQDCLSEAAQRLKTECATSPWGDMFLGEGAPSLSRSECTIIAIPP